MNRDELCDFSTHLATQMVMHRIYRTLLSLSYLSEEISNLFNYYYCSYLFLLFASYNIHIKIRRMETSQIIFKRTFPHERFSTKFTKYLFFLAFYNDHILISRTFIFCTRISMSSEGLTNFLLLQYYYNYCYYY